MLSFDGPLFIVGMPRSGTKLLRDLLNRHPSIAIPDVETEFLPLLARRLRSSGDLSRFNAFSRLCSDLSTLSYFEFRKAQGRRIDPREWYENCKSYDAASIFEALVRLDTGTPIGNARIWGDKSPSYINDIELIDVLYPAGRIIHIVRDVRDYCVSIHKAWGKDRLRAAQRWADCITLAHRQGGALGERYIELRYEDLLREPETQLRRICKFLALDFVPEMTTLQRPSESVGRARGEVRIKSDNVGSFVDSLPSSLCSRIEAIAGEVMRNFGYELKYPLLPAKRLARPRLLLGRFLDGINLVLRGRKHRGVIGSLIFHWRFSRTARQ